jgi:hypothetical protein
MALSVDHHLELCDAASAMEAAADAEHRGASTQRQLLGQPTVEVDPEVPGAEVEAHGG